MANILQVSELRNDNGIMKDYHKGEWAYLTKNGKGHFVFMNIEDYE